MIPRGPGPPEGDLDVALMPGSSATACPAHSRSWASSVASAVAPRCAAQQRRVAEGLRRLARGRGRNAETVAVTCPRFAPLQRVGHRLGRDRPAGHFQSTSRQPRCPRGPRAGGVVHQHASGACARGPQARRDAPCRVAPPGPAGRCGTRQDRRDPRSSPLAQTVQQRRPPPASSASRRGAAPGGQQRGRIAWAGAPKRVPLPAARRRRRCAWRLLRAFPRPVQIAIGTARDAEAIAFLRMSAQI
jgi:hypothetical protein